MFQKAKRSQSKLRLALIGPSGSGKTYSALLIASGLGGSVAVLDTERGSGSLYADLTEYDTAELSPPYSPERYIEMIHAAEKAGYTTLIIDSLSHAWSGPGGILEYVDRASQSLKNNFAAWREASPKHNALVDAILQSPCHIIGTMRSKTAWEVQKDEKTGKTKPVKVGLAPQQRDGLEYEFTAVLELSVDGHIATASKDRTGLFDGQYFVPGRGTGEALAQWLGGTVEQKKGGDPFSVDESLKLLKHDKDPGLNQIFTKLHELGLSGQVKEYEQYLHSKYSAGIKDLSPDQITHQLENLERCKQDPELLEKLKNYLVRLAA